MGVIDDGSVSGVLPSTKLFAVHYPGYPSSITRAVETLGGTDGIVKARSSHLNKLELRFRPEDPYSHPAFGELYHCNSFLLKISKNRVEETSSAVDMENTSKSMLADTNNQDPNISFPESLETEHIDQIRSESVSASATVKSQVSEEVQGHLCADIVAQVTESYHFNGMADYQHVLAVHADISRRKKRNWADVDPQFEKRGLLDVDQEDLMMLVPPLFSPKDMPEKLVLKPSMEVTLKQKQVRVIQHRWEMDIEPGLALDFNSDVPRKVNWEKYLAKSSEQWQWQMAVCNLFEERPVWKKDSLAEKLHDKGLRIGDNMLRRLLYRAAYYFSNGPFLKFWIRRGYDPRKDVESRVYQRIDFRVPPSLRSYCDANMTSKHRWSDISSFRVFPYKCQTSLQLFELLDDYIQKEIRSASTQPTCSLATGWFSSRVLNTLRFRVAVRFLEIYPKDGAESSLKNASTRFEKSKKMQSIVKDQRPNDGHKEVVKEGVDNEEKELNDDDEEEEEEEEEDDEVEDDIAEDEFNTYDELDLAGDSSLQPSSYTGQQNISKDYLQELFGSFPISDGGGVVRADTANSDDEYPIYEQYSDINYSTDDEY
ncbi:general transcription factor 3C polypeptide 5-like [Heracleum sosnowskyi]|uniref:General transcription factor 3C polypeptide 5-like n=2 Tax=Heracleum sosnowskyi TaxID=360622 RepID=A0AAD8ISQ4_9APIA|nr:general transcription factor 3C polypeptide 5-like [Heracleum sosnowskyi]